METRAQNNPRQYQIIIWICGLDIIQLWRARVSDKGILLNVDFWQCSSVELFNAMS